jgi:hypothetical protein
MIARLDATAGATRHNHLAAGAFVAIASCLAATRALEDPGNPATLFRMAVSLVAIAFVVLARRQSLLRKATIFFALEAVGGVVSFAYIDVPFVMHHQAQIHHIALLLYAGLHGR